MNLKIIFPLLLIAALPAVFSGCSSSTDAAVSSGKANFKGYGCATCHRIGNEGGSLGPDLTYIGFRKTAEWMDIWLKDPHAWKPNTVMPNFYLTDQVRKSLVDYMVSLKGQDYQGNPPWNDPKFADDPVKRGEVIFKRVGCVGCHGNEGIGRFPNNNVVGGQIPGLKTVSDGYSKEELKDKIKKGVIPEKENASLPAPHITMPAWGEVLKDDELDAVVEYLYSLKPASAKADEW